ncbi:50S ribosomal protein L18e [Candidatus Marsarchaeota archaeon]|nr:50S ribosomal protein L18e [Candidatus Marsarchaeota archaeon]MCL5405076.1 50S ribosomal protein L18e [Candidatus Marsarchaeota archaeon]
MKITPERSDIKDLISMLSDKSMSKGAAPIAGRLYQLLAVPRRKRVNVNLYKINRYSKEGDHVVVPGKVLSMGSMDHKVSIAALEFSEGAKAKLDSAGCSIKPIKEMLDKKNAHIIV